MRKGKNTIGITKKLKKQKKRRNNMKKIFLAVLLMSFTGCSTITEKAGKLVPNIGECPPKGERAFSDILCQEKK